MAPVRADEAEALFKEFRCMVCVGESIAESRAEVAEDMRRDIRARVAAGEGAESIREYYVAQYGQGVLMNPPFNGQTLVLWLGPGVFLLGGVCWIWAFRRKKSL